MIPISKPLLGEEEQQAVLEVMASGHLVQGPRTAEFEQRFAAVVGTRHAIAVSSGTTALWVALLAHGIGEGDEVITSPFTFIASANSILFTGARPVFVDIEASSFNLDLNQIEAAITPRTKAIMPVHLYGNPVDMPALVEIANRHGLAVIEDCAQSIGASVGGRATGSFGTGCFSLYATKNICTGEGGMITTDDDAVADQCRMLRAHGMRVRYYHEQLGYNFRLTDLQSAIGIVQLSKLEQFTLSREANARYLTEHLRHVVTPAVRPNTRHVFHQYTIRVPGDREEIARRLGEDGIGTGIFYPVPIHKQQVYVERGYSDQLPVSEQIAREVISLPVHPALRQPDLDAIVSAVNKATSEIPQGSIL